MNKLANRVLRCPLCHSELMPMAKTWQCTGDNSQNNPQSNSPNRQHSFDVAKQGYVNLLPVQHKKSKNPGDTEQAVLARQRFLSAGYYQVLADGLQDFCQQFISDIPQRNWLDIGCGEGYYTERFLQLSPKHLLALDISKSAVIATAKRLKPFLATQACYPMVASASQVPVFDQSLNVISSIFSPILPNEFARILADNGQVIIAKPAPNHLVQMREALFEQVQAHDSDKFIDEMASHFTLGKEQRITHQITVNSEALADVLTMTPYTYRAKPTNRQALMQRCEQLGELALTLDFVIYGFNKR
ncbi:MULTISPECIES: putative RNA methyltransferase [unclassified Moraxella]|uniref:putative RNA methyltransferase n=1 Tax=unclassified Moraxella TaxID=2685852 RepID=UPI003AF4F999